MENDLASIQIQFDDVTRRKKGMIEKLENNSDEDLDIEDSDSEDFRTFSSYK